MKLSCKYLKVAAYLVRVGDGHKVLAWRSAFLMNEADKETLGVAMANQDPMEGLFLNLPASVSKRTFNIAGISVNVYGLEELGPSARNVSCIWLLHPRLQTQECMAPLATAILNSWNSRREKTTNGLLAVTFDQRNHGSREIDSLSNEAWRSGNEQHAQDMFSIYRTHIL